MKTETCETIFFYLAGFFLLFCVVHFFFGEIVTLWVFRVFIGTGIIAGTAYGGFSLWNKALRDIHRRKIENQEDVINLRKQTYQAEYSVIPMSGPALAVLHRNIFTGNPESSFHEVGFRRPPGGIMPSEPQNKPDPFKIDIGEAGNGLKPVLPVLKDTECLLICGGRGRGKTNLAQWLLKISEFDTVMILDPKPYRQGKWPTQAQIFGLDYDYAEIKKSVIWLNENMRTDMGRFVMVIDEINLINQNIPEFPNLWVQCLEAGREHGKGVWVIGQSKTAKSLGLSGAYDLLANFDYLATAKWKRSTDERWVELEEQGEPVEIYAQPGPFGKVSGHGLTSSDTDGDEEDYAVYQGYNGHDDHDRRDNHDRQDTLYIQYSPEQEEYVQWVDPKPKQVYESKQDKIIVEMYQAGKSLNEIARAVWGASNGRRTKMIKGVLERYGL